VAEVTRLADGVEALVAAASATSGETVSAEAGAQDEGLDAVRLRSLLIAVKGIGEVTADALIAQYKAGE